LAVVGVPKARVGWFIWTQTGGTIPLSIYIANLETVTTPAATILPVFKIHGQVQNATLVNVKLSFASSISSELAAITFQTGTLDGSSLILDTVRIENVGGAVSSFAEVIGFSSVTGRSLSFAGNLDNVTFEKNAAIGIVGGSWTLERPTSTVIFQHSRHVSISSVQIFNTGVWMHENVFSNIFGSLLKNVALSTGTLPQEECPTGISSFQALGNTFDGRSSLTYTLQGLSGLVTCSSNLFPVIIVGNSFKGTFETRTDSGNVWVNFRGNYWSSSTGPTVCSNPGGAGASISYGMDFSAWCEDATCQKLNDYPNLLPEVILGPCQKPTAAAIIIFVFIFFIIVAANVVKLIIYCLYCGPRKTDTENIHIHYAKMTSVMSTLAAFSLVILAFAGVIGSVACPTRVYATKCPFTITDKAVAGNGLLFGSLIALIATGTVLLLKFKFQEQRPILYTSIGFQVLSLGVSILIIVISLLGLSSALRGPYMHLLAVPAAGYALFCILSIYHSQFLRIYCRHTHIAMELSDYRHERAGLLSGQSTSSTSSSTHPSSHSYQNDHPVPSSASSDVISEHSVGEKEGHGSVSSVESKQSSSVGSDSTASYIYHHHIDEYTMQTVHTLQVFYSDYQKTTQNWLIAENLIFALLLAFSIWYTTASYRISGALLITVVILEYLRIILVIFVTRGRGPILGFKVIMVFTAITKLSLLVLSIFLFVQVFTLTSHTSAYFTASLLAPSFFLGCITTIRVWKMFEAVHEKNQRLPYAQ